MKDKPSKNRLVIILNLILLKVLTIILAIILFFLLPLAFVLSIPIFACRYIVKIAAKFIRPDLNSMVTARGVLFAIDSLYKRTKCSLVINLVFEGTLDLERVTELVNQRLILGRLENGDLKYPELTQCLTQWMGYYFWKSDQHFDIKNHVTLHPMQNFAYGESDIKQIMEDLVQKPWIKNRPLWELRIVNNCELKGVKTNEGQGSQQTAIIFRTHHSLADGFSLFSLGTEGLAEFPGKIKNAKPQEYRRTQVIDIILYSLTFPFRCVYEVAEAFVIPLQPHISIPFTSFQNKQSGRLYMDTTDRIPIQKLKEIKNHFGVSFSSVLFASVAGALRDILIKKGMDIPVIFPLIIPLPIPGHSNKLRNYMSAAITNLCLLEENPVTRLKYCSRDYKRVKKSAFPMFATNYMPMLGLYFSWITKIFARNYFSSSWLSNFPGGLEPFYIDGCKCLDGTWIAGLEMGRTGIGFCAFSYVDGIRITPIVDAAVMTREDLRVLTDLIETHIDILHEKIFLDV